MYYVNTFFIYSIIGYLFESVIYLFCEGQSGILYGPWTPVYGLGVVILCLFYYWMKEKNYSMSQIMVGEFFVGLFVLSFLEWLGGHLLEYFFDIVFWNYEGLPFHIGKYISLETSFVWAFFSCLCVKFLKPWTDKFTKKIPKFVTFVVLIFFIIDILVTCIHKMELAVFFYPFF